MSSKNDNPLPNNERPPFPPLGGQIGAVEHQHITKLEDGPVMEDMVPNWDNDNNAPALCAPVDEVPSAIAAAAATIAGSTQAATQKLSNKTRRRSCTFPNCTRYAQRHGVCCKHGANLKKKQCSHPNCTNQAKKGGICVKHGAKIPLCKWVDPVTRETCPNHAKKSGVCRRHGAKVVEKTCKFDGCSNHIQANGLCIRHGAPVKKCSYGGCVNKVQKEGLCKRHLTLRDKLGGSIAATHHHRQQQVVEVIGSHQEQQRPQQRPPPPSYEESVVARAAVEAESLRAAAAAAAEAESSREKQHEVKEVPLSVLHAALGLTSLHNNTGGKSSPPNSNNSPKTTNKQQISEPSSLIVRSSSGGLIVGNRDKDVAAAEDSSSSSSKVRAANSAKSKKKRAPVRKVGAAEEAAKRARMSSNNGPPPPQDRSLYRDHHHLMEAAPSQSSEGADQRLRGSAILDLARFYRGIGVDGKAAADDSAETTTVAGIDTHAMRRAITNELNDQMTAERLKYYPEYPSANKMGSAAAAPAPFGPTNQQSMLSLEERMTLYQKLASLPTSTLAKLIPTSGGGYTYPPASTSSIAAAYGRRDDDNNMGVLRNMLLPSQLPPTRSSLGGMMGGMGGGQGGGGGGGASSYNIMSGGISQPPHQPSYESSISSIMHNINMDRAAALSANLQQMLHPEGGDRRRGVELLPSFSTSLRQQMLETAPPGYPRRPPAAAAAAGPGSGNTNAAEGPPRTTIPTRLTNLTNPEMFVKSCRPGKRDLAFAPNPTTQHATTSMEQHEQRRGVKLAQQHEAANAAWAKLAQQQLATDVALAKLAHARQQEAEAKNGQKSLSSLEEQAREAMAKGWIQPGSGKSPSVGHRTSYNRKLTNDSNSSNAATERKNGSSSDGLWDLEGAIARFQQSSSSSSSQPKK